MATSEVRTFTLSGAEAALVIWEELDRRTWADSAGRFPEEYWWRARNGTYALRRAALSLACHVEGIFHSLPVECWGSYAYDWEIVPAILDWVRWEPEGPTPLIESDERGANTVLTYLRGHAGAFIGDACTRQREQR